MMRYLGFMEIDARDHWRHWMTISFLEPGGSVKDRVAMKLMETAEAGGLLTPHSGDKVYEGTVGSTGVSLAILCRARGYLAHICMPNDQATEKSDLTKLGAEVEHVPPAPIADRAQFVNKARARSEEHTNSPSIPGRGFFADQFENEANSVASAVWPGPLANLNMEALDT
ncbi:tryptophan synthase beta subunit-like PLP-dependent enzyme [Tuber borchii]|uniref:Tryptophan synthase beta subunit-like PLP-dependent enzyme n=1 Tax=Tuber borchii TaxID=42251 RepID=A0A2T6ZI67_TUBBO|nr:tryptophan synthase beta subunit-like PLP-dependent enzyme [Tuber borchii]